MRHLLTLAVVATIVAIPGTTAANDFADACRRFASAHVVFIGHVTGPPVRRHVSSQEQIDRFERKRSGAKAEMAKTNMWPIPLDFVLTPMRVETGFRNIETAVVYVRTQQPATLRVGQSYLIYGSTMISPAFPDILFATLVIPEPDPGSEEMRFLNLARTRKFSASIYGSVVLHDSGTRVPLSGVPIRFSVGDQVIDAISSPEGKFIVTGIPAGNISVEPLLPPELILNTPVVPWVVSLPDGGCEEVNLDVRNNRRIRGRILRPDGSPVTGAPVELAPLVESVSQLRMQYTNQTNDNGEFEFRGLAARTYVMGINLRSLPTSGAPYTATYYPTPLEVGDATQLDDIEWILDAPLPTGEIEVIVNSGRDGSSEVVTACAVPLGADGHSQGENIVRIRRGAERLIMSVVEGVRYRIVARANGDRRVMDSELVELVGTAGRQSITLRTDSPALPDTNPCQAAF
jgi:hypothetical protein